MFLVFTKQKNLWKFHAFLTTLDQVQLEKKHLDYIGFDSKIIPASSFDLSKIKEIEETINT